MQPFELKNASRIHLFASNEFSQIYKSSEPVSKLVALNEANLEGRFFQAVNRHSVILGTYFKNVVILSVRGTVFRRLWDWKANVDKRKFNVSSRNHYPFEYDSIQFDDQFFHRGFFESIVPHFSSIAEHITSLIKQSKQDDISIIWTGHSLGGAMAAVGNAISQTRYYQIEKMPGIIRGAYTFGMPRYCGLGSTCLFASPFHIYKKQDLVPTVPLRKMGFSDSPREYEISENGNLAPAERDDTFGILGHIPSVRKSLKAHSIEGYAELLAKATGIPRYINKTLEK